MAKIVTRFSIWDEAEIVLFDENDYDKIKDKIDLKSTLLLVSPGTK